MEEPEFTDKKMRKIKELLQIEDEDRQLEKFKELDEETLEKLTKKIKARREKLEAEKQ